MSGPRQGRNTITNNDSESKSTTSELRNNEGKIQTFTPPRTTPASATANPNSGNYIRSSSSRSHLDSEGSFHPPSSISEASSTIGKNTGSTRRQTSRYQHQQIQDSFAPPSPGNDFSKNIPMNNRQDSSRSASSIPFDQSNENVPTDSKGTRGGHHSTKRSDPWVTDASFNSGPGRSNRQNFGNHPGSNNGPPQQRHPQYPHSVARSSSPTDSHYGYDSSLHRDLHPPIGSISDELELAAKEDGVLDIGAAFICPPSSTTPHTKGMGSDRLDMRINDSEKDAIHRGGNGGRMHHSSNQQYQRFQGSGYSHAQDEKQKYDLGMHPQQQYRYQHGNSASHNSQSGYPPSYSTHHQYSQSHPPHISQQMKYASSSYPGPNKGSSMYSSTYSQNSTMRPWSPHSSYNRNDENDRNSSIQHSQFENSRGPPDEGNNKKRDIDNINLSDDRPPSPLHSKRHQRDRRNNSGWSETNDDANDVTPEKLSGPNNSKNDRSQIGMESFRSPVVKEKESNDRNPSSSNKKNQRGFNETPGSTAYNNYAVETPRGQLDFSPMGSTLGHNFLMDDTPSSRMDHQIGNPFGDDNFGPGGNHNQKNQSSFGNNKNYKNAGSCNHHQARRPTSPTMTQSDAYLGSNLPPRSPFSNFVGQMSPLPKASNAGGFQSSPFERPDNHYYGGSFPNEREFGMYHPKSRGDFDPSTRGYGYNERYLRPGGPQSSPQPRRGESGYRDRLDSESSTGPIRFQIGDFGMKQSDVRKGLDGINKTIRGPALTQKRAPPSSSPPSFPFVSDSSTNSHLHSRSVSSSDSSNRHMHSMRMGYDHDMYGTPLTNLSNRSSRGSSSILTTPSSGSAYRSYHSQRTIIPGSGSTSGGPPHHYPPYGSIGSSGGSIHPLSAGTPIKSSGTPGKENDKSGSGGDRRAPCNCKRSRCLKLYCECFAAERYCSGCNCHDCNNIPAYESMRSEAIKATRAKNPNAFKPRFTSKYRSAVIPTATASSPPSGHNMGCRCKKSACLKKYCECFEAGVVCGDKCKCVNCQNFVGSQALIDRRRKIKDHHGAEIAMRSADQAWKARGLEKKNGPRQALSSSSSSTSRKNSNRGVGVSPMKSSHGQSPREKKSQPFMPPPMDERTGGGGDYSEDSSSHGYGKMNLSEKQDDKGRRPIARHISLGSSSSSKKDIKAVFDPNEPTLPVFGPSNPPQTKSVVLYTFSYLSNDDLFNASLVSKLWTKISLDDELWQM